MPRNITELVVHCAATSPNMDIGAAEITKWHLKQGWKTIGYHYVIRRDGKIEDGRPIEQVGAHVQGHNANSIGICLVGGVDSKGKAEANFTAAQMAALQQKLLVLKGLYPTARICGHRDFPGVKKDCPSFDVASWLANGKL